MNDISHLFRVLLPEESLKIAGLRGKDNLVRRQLGSVPVKEYKKYVFWELSQCQRRVPGVLRPASQKNRARSIVLPGFDLQVIEFLVLGCSGHVPCQVLAKC